MDWFRRQGCWGQIGIGCVTLVAAFLVCILAGVVVTQLSSTRASTPGSPPAKAGQSAAGTAPRTPTATPPGFGDGQKIVGQDIQPGTYRTKGQPGCYWERLGGFGGTTQDILANDNPPGPDVVTIEPTDKGFTSRRCGWWTDDLSPITGSQTAPIPDGTFLVGTDIAAGTWRAGGGSGCYWERLKGFSGRTEDIIANGLGTEAPVVTIAPTDAGFSSSRCGTWTKIG